MREYDIIVRFVVDARDHDEAVEIAKAAREAIERFPYRVRDLESDVEEVK